MNYYNEIKQELISNGVYKKAKDYSKNRSDLRAYYNVGKILAEAGKHYGEGIIKEYSIKLTNELGYKYSVTTLKYMRQFYEYGKSQPAADQLTWSHYVELLSIKNVNKINYYINICIDQNLSKRKLREKIKNKEYERLDDNTKEKLIKSKTNNIEDFIKNPILIKSNANYMEISEKLLKQLILEDLDNFLLELGEGFTYIKSEYKIKIADRYNYIDLLLYNIKYNCYVVIELKITELKAEYIGQIKKYMNYIDKNVKTINEAQTIGIIICQKDNMFIMEYCSDDRVFRTIYIFN